MRDLSSGKGSRDENFPVASVLIAKKHRPMVMRFYAVARLADDIADHPTAAPEEKLRRLDEIEATLDGADAVPEAVALREAMAAQNLSDRHVRDLLVAFRHDAVQRRYEAYEALLDYCRYSAAPVGRFVLDVHGESPALWPENDALCAALQIINHVQDCAKDYRELDRVYVPEAMLAANGETVKALAAARSSPGLLSTIRELAGCAQDLLRISKPFAGAVRDRRLSAEVAVIHRLAEDLAERLSKRDPLQDRVHHTKAEALALAVSGAAGSLLSRPRAGRRPAIAA